MIELKENVGFKKIFEIKETNRSFLLGLNINSICLMLSYLINQKTLQQ